MPQSPQAATSLGVTTTATTSNAETQRQRGGRRWLYRVHGETPVPLGWADPADEPRLVRHGSGKVVVPPKEWGIEGPDVAAGDLQSLPLSDG
jgi:hypothetical protein